MSAFDVVFIGSAPDALAGAARLARAGKRVAVLESAPVCGGPAVTEEFAPGFRADTALASLALDDEVARDLDLGVEPLARAGLTAVCAGAAPVTLTGQPAWPAGLATAVDDAVALLRALHRTPPPAVPAVAGHGAETLSGLAARLTGLGARRMHEVLRLVFMPVRDVVREAHLPGEVAALVAGAAVREVSEGPFSPGTFFGYLHQMALGDGIVRATARGGLSTLVDALVRRARGHGVDVRTGLGPVTIDVDEGGARGVRLATGEVLAAAAVVSTLDARATFTRLVSPAALEPEFNRAVRALRYRGRVARVHLALEHLPRFEKLGNEALAGSLVLAPALADLERAHDAAKRGTLAATPWIELALPTVADPSLAPAGRHVLSAWVSPVPTAWTDADAVRELVLSRLASVCGGARPAVLSARVDLPRDLAARHDLTEGQLSGGELRLDQAFFLRPFPGHHGHRTPVENLYLAGAAAHPGGHTGRSGWNLAGVLAD